MLRKYSNSRTLGDNIKLGVLTAVVAGMVNVLSLLLFFSFSSNVTGYFAIISAEVVQGNWYQAAIVFAWIFLFFFGNFVANFMIIHFKERNRYFAHSLPIILEIICLLTVGVYGSLFYGETLSETEAMLALMLFAMGLQNGLTASISNFAVKTTHLTGTTTDLAILFSMFTKSEYRSNEALRGRTWLLSAIMVSHVAGAVIGGVAFFHIGFRLFYFIAFFLVIVILYDTYKISMVRYSWVTSRKKIQESLAAGELMKEEKNPTLAN